MFGLSLFPVTLWCFGSIILLVVVVLLMLLSFDQAVLVLVFDKIYGKGCDFSMCVCVGGGGGVGGRLWRWGKREGECHHQHYSCIEMGSDENHFNV